MVEFWGLMIFPEAFAYLSKKNGEHLNVYKWACAKEHNTICIKRIKRNVVVPCSIDEFQLVTLNYMRKTYTKHFPFHTRKESWKWITLSDTPETRKETFQLAIDWNEKLCWVQNCLVLVSKFWTKVKFSKNLKQKSFSQVYQMHWLCQSWLLNFHKGIYDVT